jgi:hypothetical protein
VAFGHRLVDNALLTALPRSLPRRVTSGIRGNTPLAYSRRNNILLKTRLRNELRPVLKTGTSVVISSLSLLIVSFSLSIEQPNPTYLLFLVRNQLGTTPQPSKNPTTPSGLAHAHSRSPSNPSDIDTSDPITIAAQSSDSSASSTSITMPPPQHAKVVSASTALQTSTAFRGPPHRARDQAMHGQFEVSSLCVRDDFLYRVLYSD